MDTKNSIEVVQLRAQGKSFLDTQLTYKIKVLQRWTVLRTRCQNCITLWMQVVLEIKTRKNLELTAAFQSIKPDVLTICQTIYIRSFGNRTQATIISKAPRWLHCVAKIKSYYSQIQGPTLGRFRLASETNGTSSWKNRKLNERKS